jgi:hypothetical protein
MHQLPHKARNLEEKLYRTAPSLEAYLDRTTLKNRLRRLAQVITKQYKEGNHHQMFSRRRNSTSSHSSITTIVSSSGSRDSFSSANSLDSLRSLHESFAQISTIPTVVEGPNAGDGNQMTRMSDSDRSSFSGRSLGVISEETKGLSPSSSVSTGGTSANIVQSNSMQEACSTSMGISELERQKAVNEKLQQQILENIREQEELVQKLQARSQGGGQDTASSAPGIPTRSNSLHFPGGNDQVQMNLFLSEQNRMNNNAMMAHAALLNNTQHQNRVIQSSQGQLQAEGSFHASAFVTGNPTLQQLQQSLRTQQALVAQQQMQLLRSDMFGVYPSVVSSLQASSLASFAGGAQANAPSGTFNPTMPPPPMQRPTMAETLSSPKPSASTETKDSPLSPSSFHW